MPPGERNGAAQALPTPGHVIGGKYEIVRVIGEGGMGVVFEAQHLKLRQRVAVKMLLPEMLAHDIIVTRFEREARASGQLRNRHTVRVMDVDVTDTGLPYMVMEFLEGHDLQTELDLRERLPLAEAVHYVLQACSAMVEAHQLGIVHRDLKPANLFLALESDARDPSAGRLVKVLDFGISKLQAEGDVKLTVAETVIGTAMYMSPEQIRSSGEVDARTDIWALGIILYELLCGRPPWIGVPTQLAALIVSEDAPDVRTYAADVPAEVAAIIRKALTRDPRERHADVKQLARALAPYSPTGTSGIPSSVRFPQASRAGAAQPQISLRPPELEDANTLLQAPAVSESRMRGSGGGTTPGWTQSGQPDTRSRTLLLGFLAAFAIGLIVVGGGAMVWVRSHPSDAAAGGSIVPDAASPAISPPDTAKRVAAPLASPATIAVAASPTTAAEPASSTSPGAAAHASASAAPADSAVHRPRVAPHPPATVPATATATAPATVTAAAPHKPPAPPPVTAPAGNPIHL
jgi:serine/threonine-protein kinase